MNRIGFSEIISEPKLYGFHQYIDIRAHFLPHKVSVSRDNHAVLTRTTRCGKTQLFPLKRTIPPICSSLHASYVHIHIELFFLNDNKYYKYLVG